ncbi:SH3 domain-containing protein [Amphritea pacifica]|uniref:SH3b domain-containing protein n=1 Tax=Amphritea pacifica TaxID=2811233 RepID=A0ABS2WA52_9GAMM|nr:SH3 domain-containing protein [Amphritea pacifica]MBN0988461.1 hypothetical protein [Amphritea pacifica]
MTVLRRLIICSILMISSLPQTLSATERLEIVVRSTILNIRESRSTHSPVVGVLSEGDRLTVTTTDMRDWIRLDDGRGFISIHYVRVLSRTPVLLAPPEERSAQSLIPPAESLRTAFTSSPEIPVVDSLDRSQSEDNLIAPTTGATAQESPIPASPGDTAAHNPSPDTTGKQQKTRVTVESVSKTCRKNLHTSGYEFCQLLFKLKLSAEQNSAQRVKITCAAEALASNDQNNQILYELTNTRSVSSSLSSTSIIVDWSPANEQNAIRHVALKEGVCTAMPTSD